METDVTRPIDLSLLVPLKDEQDSIGQLTSEIVSALSVLESHGLPWEVILIDDGSTDDTWVEIEKVAVQDHRFKGVRLRRNFGKSAALAAGLASTSGTVIAMMDGDLQDDPAEIPYMVDRIAEEGVDLVAGYKAKRKDPLGKRLPSKVFNFFTSLVTGLKLKDHNCGLKAGRREVFEAVPLYGEMHRYLAAIAHAQGFSVVEQPVHHRPRQYGRSKFGLERYARGGLDLLTVLGLTRYMSRPAHLFGGVGLALGLVGSLILVYLSGIWVFTDQPIGARPLLLFGVLLVLVAVQLVSLGILAEMIVHRDRPREDPLRDVIDLVNLDL